MQNGVICTRDPSGLAATSPGQGRSWGERFLDRGGVGGEKKKGGEEDNEQKNSYIGTIIH